MRLTNVDTTQNKKLTARNSSVANFKRPSPMNNILTQVDESNYQTTNKNSLTENPHQRTLSPLPNRVKSFDNFLLQEQHPDKAGKKTLILDLDETLVHSGFEPFKVKADIEIKIEIDGHTAEIYVLKRPGVEEFLEKMTALYEVVIFTASIQAYADPLMDILDSNNLCSYRLFRESCTLLTGYYVKEMKRMNRNMRDTIIIDNNPVSYYLDTHSGLPIKSFFTDPSDNELKKITPFLEKLATVKDVREVIRDVVTKNQINYKKIDEFLAEDSRIQVEEAKTEVKMVTKQIEKVLNSSSSSSIKRHGTTSSIDIKKTEIKNLDKNSNKSSNSNILNTSYQTGSLTTRNEKITKPTNTINIRTVKKGLSTVTPIKKEEPKKNTNLKIVKVETSSSNYVTNKLLKPKVEGVFKKSSSIVNFKSKTTQNLKAMYKPLVRTSSQIKMDPNLSYTGSVRYSKLSYTTKQVSPIKSTYKESLTGNLRRTSSAITNKYSSLTKASLPSKTSKNDTSMLASFNNSMRRTSPFANSPDKNKLMRTNSAENRLKSSLGSPKKSSAVKNYIDSFRSSESKFRTSTEDRSYGMNNSMSKYASTKNTFGTEHMLYSPDIEIKSNAIIPSSVRNSVHMTTVKELAEYEASKILTLDESSKKTSASSKNANLLQGNYASQSSLKLSNFNTLNSPKQSNLKTEKKMPKVSSTKNFETERTMNSRYTDHNKK